jgi:hypothetical protein
MRWLARVVCALPIAASAAAQNVTVRGVVYDSLHSRPLAGAFVAIGARLATTDSAGRFAIADVAPGSYRVTAQHDAIDRLGISAVGTRARETDGRDPVTLTVPSFNALWRLACGDRPPPADTGFVFGTLRSERPVRNANVSASWIDVVANGTKISQKLRTLEVSADTSGSFALCGVPTTTGLTLHASSDSLESGQFDIGPLDRERVVRRDLSLGAPVAAAIAAGRGASIAGRVLADSGHGPIANAELALTDLGVTTTTNERGEYEFKQLAPGSHRLYVRKIGYAESEISFDVEEAERLSRDVVLSRITILDSMQVNAKPLARDEAMRTFEEHRKIGLGTFLTQDELDKANGRNLPQMMVFFPSLQIALDPKTGKYKPRFIGRGPKSMMPTGGCPVKVYVDGALDHDPDLNAYPPDVIAGVEYYRGAAQTPAEYASLGSICGVIVIHLRKR